MIPYASRVVARLLLGAAIIGGTATGAGAQLTGVNGAQGLPSPAVFGGARREQPGTNHVSLSTSIFGGYDTNILLDNLGRHRRRTVGLQRSHGEFARRGQRPAGVDAEPPASRVLRQCQRGLPQVLRRGRFRHRLRWSGGRCVLSDDSPPDPWIQRAGRRTAVLPVRRHRWCGAGVRWRCGPRGAHARSARRARTRVPVWRVRQLQLRPVGASEFLAVVSRTGFEPVNDAARTPACGGLAERQRTRC